MHLFRFPRVKDFQLSDCKHAYNRAVGIERGPHLLLRVRRGASRRLKADRQESPSERIKQLVAEQQRIQQELAELQEQAGDLSPDELAELKTLLAAAETSAPAADEQKDAEQQLQKETEPGRGKGKGAVPPDVARFFSGAGVFDAMDNTAAPREPTDETGQSNSDKLKEVVMKAGREDATPRAVPRTDFGTDIPESEEEYQDDEYLVGDDEEFEIGEGVDEMVQRLESGLPLPPDPNQADVVPETSEEYKARIDKLKAAFDAQFLPKKDWQISEEEYKKLWNHEVQADFPAGQAPEIDKVQPAPMWPKKIQAQYDRFQWVFYLLRKAYMQPSPDSAAQHLIDAGLVSDAMLYEDPMIESEGPAAWLEYSKRLVAAGGRIEVDNIWGQMSEERDPTWRVWVDIWLSMPYPEWYQRYFDIHRQFPDPPNLGNTMADDSLPPDPWSDPPPKWTPPPLRYPKGLERLQGPEEDEVVRPRRKPRPPKKDRKEAKLKQEEAKGFEEADVLTRLRVFARDPSMEVYYKGIGLPGDGDCESLDLMRRCIRAAEGNEPSASTGAESDAEPPNIPETASHIGFQYQSREADAWEGPPHRRRRKRRWKHIVTSWEQPEDPDIEEMAAALRWRPDFGEGPTHAHHESLDKDRDSGKTRLIPSQEVSLPDGNGLSQSFEVFRYGRLRHEKPRSPLPDMPVKEEDLPAWHTSDNVGQAWRNFKWFCIPMTVCHTVDNDLKQVDKVKAVWGASIGFALGTSRDHRDIYNRQLQLYERHDASRQRIKLYKAARSVAAAEQEADSGANAD